MCIAGNILRKIKYTVHSGNRHEGLGTKTQWATGVMPLVSGLEGKALPMKLKSFA